MLVFTDLDKYFVGLSWIILSPFHYIVGNSSLAVALIWTNASFAAVHLASSQLLGKKLPLTASPVISGS